MNEHKALNIEERLAAQRGPIMRIAADHGAHNIRIIGSVARGQANEASDIDFLVQFEPGRTLLGHASLICELEALLGLPVDVASERGLREGVRDRVLAEAKPL